MVAGRTPKRTKQCLCVSTRHRCCIPCQISLIARCTVTRWRQCSGALTVGGACCTRPGGTPRDSISSIREPTVTVPGVTVATTCSCRQLTALPALAHRRAMTDARLVPPAPHIPRGIHLWGRQSGQQPPCFSIACPHATASVPAIRIGACVQAPPMLTHPCPALDARCSTDLRIQPVGAQGDVVRTPMKGRTCGNLMACHRQRLPKPCCCSNRSVGVRVIPSSGSPFRMIPTNQSVRSVEQ